MGSDKAFVEVEGVPLARRVAAAMAQAGIEEVAMVGRAEQQLEKLGFRVVLDRRESTHPLVGVEAALEDSALALVAPCDLAWLDAATVRSMAAADAPAVAWDGLRLHPLFALLRSNELGPVRDAIRRGAAAQALAASWHRVRVSDQALRNCNTQADLRGC
jgi:molybdopterin-guanine dinucleotide biosynthesis protein A